MYSARGFWSALGVELEEFIRRDLGLRILFGWDTGIEIITTLGSEGSLAQPVTEFLTERGSGVRSVVYGVPSLDDAVERLRQEGLTTRRSGSAMTGDEPWFGRYTHLEEAAVVGAESLRLILVEKEFAVQPANSAGALSHVIYCVPLEDLAEHERLLRSTLGVEFENVDMGNPDLEIRYSGSSGLELLAPTLGARGPAAEALAETGPGPFLVAFGVPSIDEAVDKAQHHIGAPPVQRLNYTGSPGWSDRYTVLEEAVLPPVCGMRVALVQSELR
jgi:hypothetical protein